MITIQLNGGIGNQMFQYAVGRAISLRYHVPLALDIALCKRNPQRPYGLCHFTISGQLVEVSWASVKLKSAFGKVCKERFFHYDPSIMNCPDGMYLQGYWQSEKYFKDIEKIIRDDFTFSKEADYLNKQMAYTISNCESVSLHVRRGDYLSNPVTNQHYEICSEDYYHRAIRGIERYCKTPHFFIFSDDPVWTHENLDTGHPTTILDFNGSEKDYEDMRLMSLCQHHIIANSSFSWWGAWLSRNPQKIVIAPAKWFKRPEINTKDLIPESWIRL